MRAVRRGAGARAGRHRRQLLRARRPFAAGDAADQPHPRHPRMSRSRSAACSRPRPSRRWPDASTQAQAAARRRWCPLPRPAEIAAVVCAAAAVVPRSAGGPASSTYTIPVAVRLTGALDVAALEAALGDLVARHESLRTVFPDTLGVPRQLILDASVARPKLAVTAVTEASLPNALADAARPRLRSRRRACAASASVRAREKRARAAAAGASHRERWLVAGAAGARSRAAPMRRGATGRRPTCRPLPVQYADYTLWQHQVLGDESDPQSAIARQLAFWTRDARGASRPARSAERPAAPGGVELSRRQRAAVAVGGRSTLACWRWRARGGRACSWCCRQRCAALLTPAGGGQRHPDRQPDCGPHRQRARRADRVLRQHAGAAHRHVGQSELPRADRAGAGDKPRGLQPPGPAVRAAGGGAQSGAVAVAASAVPGDAGVPEQRAGERRGAARADGELRAGGDEQRQVRPVAGAGRAARRGWHAGWNPWANSNTPPTCSTQHRRGDGGRLMRLLEAAVAEPDRRGRRAGRPQSPPSAHQLLRGLERHRASRSRRRHAAELFAAQAARTPDALALVVGEAGAHLRASSTRAPNQLAHQLRARGVGPGGRWSASVRRALARDGGRAARRPEGRRRLRAARPRYPAERLASCSRMRRPAWCSRRHCCGTALPARGGTASCLDAERGRTIATSRDAGPAPVVEPRAPRPT